MPQIRVNLRTQVNKASIRREKRNGRDVIIVPSATLPDNVVMNGGLYPAEEIAKSYQSLNRTPAPLGHPVVNGKYVPAMDVEAINGFYVGAFNENVRRENGRVFLDKVIDVEVASGTERGRRLLDAINNGDPIHTSTGLLLEPEPVQNKDYKWIARNMKFDHDAILLDEPGAATPAQGVGMMVNGEAVEVQDIDLDDNELRDIAESVAWRVEHERQQAERKPLVDKIVSKLRELLSSNGASGLSVNHEDAEMPITEEMFKELSEQVKTLAANSQKQSETVAEAVQNAVKPLTERLDAIEAANKARDEAERATKVNAVVKAGLLDEETAKTLPIAALNALADKAKPLGAAPLLPGFAQNSADDFSDELPGGA